MSNIPILWDSDTNPCLKRKLQQNRGVESDNQLQWHMGSMGSWDECLWEDVDVRDDQQNVFFIDQCIGCTAAKNI